MPAVGYFSSCRLRVLLPVWLAAGGMVLPGAARADDTNGVLPVVSVRVLRNAAESGAPTGIFAIERTGDTGQALAVNYALGGTATNGVDYQRLSGAVIIPAGMTNAQIEVIPINHQQEGGAQNVTLTLVGRNQPFTLIALPDSQFCIREVRGGTLDMFAAQIQWIVDHKDALNIAFVLHEGDITDMNSMLEWTNARAGLSRLDGVVPYALAVGNHDGLETSQSLTAPFNQTFPVSQFRSRPTFGGVFESNRMDNCYHLFSVGGVDWLLFALEYGPRNAVLAWANQVATSYPNRRAIMVTHAHVYFDNTLQGSSTNHDWVPTIHSGRENDGTGVWEKFLRHHANMALTFNGHVLSSGTGRLVGVGDYGNQVFQMLANYQMLPLGGAGYLRIARFFPDQDKMSVSTYSPFLDSWLTDPGNQFVYTNLGVFTNAGPGYQMDASFAAASLTITNDNVDVAPPAVSTVTCQGIPPVIKVTFTEPVEPVSAQTPANYSLDHGLHLAGATLSPDGRMVALVPDAALVSNGLYTLTVAGVKDRARANNEMVFPATNTFVYVPMFLSEDFADDVLTGWTVVDEGTIDAPSKWLERSGRLMQLSNICGPTPNATDHRKGTFLYWNDPPAAGWSNYSFSVDFNTLDDDGVGVMFRYQNPSNYYKVDLDAQRSFRKLFKVAGGIETTLAVETNGYVTQSNQVLRVETTNSEITVLLNGTLLFGGPVTDGSLKTGTVALYSWGSQAVFFSRLRIAPLQRWPRATIQSPATGATFVQPAPVPLAVDVFCPDSPVRTVQLFGPTSLLVTLTNAPYLFQWTNLPPGSYTLTAQAVDDSGRMGISSPVGFTVAPPPPKPDIIEQPASQTARCGGGVVFRVRADGPRPLYYQWQFQGLPMAGATNPVFLLNNVQLADAGSYAVTVTNQWGSANSGPAILAVNSAAPLPGDPNAPPALYFPGEELLDPGVPLVSVNATNITLVRIDWSSNCLSWFPLLTLTNCGNTLYFTDPGAVGQPRRYYRAVAQP